MFNTMALTLGTLWAQVFSIVALTAKWVQALKNDRRDEMKNFLFSSNEVRTFVLG